MRLYNRSRDNVVLVEELRLADTFWTRLRGLLGRKGLAPAAGLVIVPCDAVHTCGMSFPLDLVFLARDGRVLATAQAVGPWRLRRCRGAHAVVELPAGALGRSVCCPGDV